MFIIILLHTTIIANKNTKKANSLPIISSVAELGVADVRGQVQCLRGKHAVELVIDPDVLRLVGGLEERA